jgi:hypothetical protein
MAVPSGLAVLSHVISFCIAKKDLAYGAPKIAPERKKIALEPKKIAPEREKLALERK